MLNNEPYCKVLPCLCHMSQETVTNQNMHYNIIMQMFLEPNLIVRYLLILFSE